MLDEQAHMPWQTCGPVQYLLMDSFSELTDQLFVHKKEGWAFCSHYQDIEHSPEFQDEFECRGLLQLGHLEQAYIAFFNWFAEEYPDTPVIFLQFPASLDQREEFKKRADEIKRVIKIIAENHTFIRVLEAGVSEVVPADGDSFPYHFGYTTKMSFVKKWVGA
jgi:hypothetical protein